MRITSWQDRLDRTATDFVYSRAYSPLVRCAGREYTPARSAHIALLVARGVLDWTPDVVEAMYWSFNSRIDRVWNRDNSAPFFDLDEGDWNRPARADLVDAGKAPLFVQKIAENVRKSGNLLGIAEPQDATPQAEVLYIADEVTRGSAPEIAAAVQKLLTARGVPFATLARGTDGWGLYDLGLWELAEQQARRFAGFIADSGAKTVVANAAHVVYALREWYPQLGLPVQAEVLHHTEYLDRLGFSGRYEGKVTFHDGSYAGRYLGIFDAPRRLLGCVDGLELVECYFNRDKANPAGALYAYFDDEWAQAIAARRAGELKLAAPVVVTEDPVSKRNLKMAGDPELKILDIAEILVQ